MQEYGLQAIRVIAKVHLEVMLQNKAEKIAKIVIKHHTEIQPWLMLQLWLPHCSNFKVINKCNLVCNLSKLKSI